MKLVINSIHYSFQSLMRRIRHLIRFARYGQPLYGTYEDPVENDEKDLLWGEVEEVSGDRGACLAGTVRRRVTCGILK